MITPRLDMILRHVSGESCADIGTDHAYIPIKLAEKGIKVIATDIRSGPLKMAEQNVKKHGQNVELRLGGGLSPIDVGEVRTIIVAGMGGEMIENIIKEDEEKARKSLLILQPMNSQYELRKYLTENNFNILKEDIAVEGFKVYNLIVAENGEADETNSEIDLHLPKSLYSHKYFPNLVAKKKREFLRIYQGLCESAGDKEKEKQSMKKLIDALEEIEKRVVREA